MSVGEALPRNDRLARVLAVFSAALFPLAIVLAWTETTLFDGDVLAERAVATLESEAVREELAVQLTDQLARRGNAQAIAFRPAAIVIAEALIDTDAFRSIFATAIRTSHDAIINDEGRAGLDLSDSLALLATGLQLEESVAANPGDRSDGTSFDQTVQRVADLPIWGLREVSATVTVLVMSASLVLMGAAVFVAERRRAVTARIGWAVAVGTAVAWLAVFITVRVVERMSDDAVLRRALGDAVWRLTSDLRMGLVAVGLLGMTVAASVTPGDRFDPERIRTDVAERVERLRATPRGTAIIGIGIVVAGIIVLTEADAVVVFAVHLAGLALVFGGVRLVVSLVPDDPAAAPTRAPRRSGLITAVVGLAVVVAIGGVVMTMRARDAAAAPLVESCLGSEELCDLRLDEVTFPGSHNAMSSVEYPGWLFAEQVDPIGGQLRRGIRALLIDTHYGRRSSVAVPGSGTPLILTDVAAEFAVPGAEVGEQGRAERAAELAALGDGVGEAGDLEDREVYLCHNHCELGAVKLVDELLTLHQFLDEHPGEIVVLIIQDATSSADVVSAFDEAGLLPEVATLSPDDPLPTVGELVDAGTQLLVFAERGDDEAPDWYHRAYDWFQETGFSFESIDDFDCEPNRGAASNPLFLVNHWVSASPPDPSLAAAANDADELRRRVDRCVDERQLTPNVIAVDFATTGDVVSVASELTADDS